MKYRLRITNDKGDLLYNHNFSDYLENVIKRIDNMSIDGSIAITNNEFLKGQKKGELMMLAKLKQILLDKKWVEIIPTSDKDTGADNL